jgi:hypothetical protein
MKTLTKIAIALSLTSVVACSDTAHDPDAQNHHRGRDAGFDQGHTDPGDSGHQEGDAGPTDEEDGGGQTGDGGTTDGGPTDAGGDASQGGDGGSDADGGTSDGGMSTDGGTSGDGGMDPDSGDGGSSGGYDTTGWDMKTANFSDSASVGTPDSYFFDVDSGSPMAASITGGGNGTWSVNVFGGMSNHLYCTGTSSCQVMLRPEDTVVVVTAITTDIGYYSLSVDYAGDGPR